MQNPQMNAKIEMFGNLIEELNYWNMCCEGTINESENDYCEEMFIETLSNIKEMRKTLLQDFKDYFNDCKTNGIPVDIGYWRVKKQLEESTFELFRS